jgi:hypothetical protein
MMGWLYNNELGKNMKWLWYILRYSTCIFLKERIISAWIAGLQAVDMNLGSPECVNHMTATFGRSCRLENRRMYLRKIGFECTSISRRFLKSKVSTLYHEVNYETCSGVTLKYLIYLGMRIAFMLLQGYDIVTCRGCAWLIDGFWIGWLDLLTLNS